jgi:hypothetical protein
VENGDSRRSERGRRQQGGALIVKQDCGGHEPSVQAQDVTTLLS